MSGVKTRAPARHDVFSTSFIHILSKLILSLRSLYGDKKVVHFFSISTKRTQGPGLLLFVVWKKDSNFILENSSENLERFLRDTT